MYKDELPHIISICKRDMHKDMWVKIHVTESPIYIMCYYMPHTELVCYHVFGSAKAFYVWTLLNTLMKKKCGSLET